MVVELKGGSLSQSKQQSLWEQLNVMFSENVAGPLFNYLIKISGSIFSASVTYAIPVVALMWGLIDGESIGIHHFFGMAAILSGVYIINYRKRLRQKKAATLDE